MTKPQLPPPNPLLGSTVDGSPAIPLVTHHLDVFRDDEKHTWGYQCFTCGHIEANFVSFLAADTAADEHPGACTCEVH